MDCNPFFRQSKYAALHNTIRHIQGPQAPKTSEEYTVFYFCLENSVRQAPQN